MLLAINFQLNQLNAIILECEFEFSHFLETKIGPPKVQLSQFSAYTPRSSSTFHSAQLNPVARLIKVNISFRVTKYLSLAVAVSVAYAGHAPYRSQATAHRTPPNT